MLIEQVPSLPLCFPLINSAVPVWCFPPPVPPFVGHFASPLVSVPSVPAIPVAPPAHVPALCQLLGLLRAGGGSWHLCTSIGPLCAHTQECCGLSHATHAQGGWKGPAGSWWPVWAGGSWRVTSAGTGSVTPVSLTWLLFPSVSVLPFLVHPPTDAVCAETSQPIPASRLRGRIGRVPSLGCVWRGAAVTAPGGFTEGGS